MGGILCEGKPADASSPTSFSCRFQEAYGTVTSYVHRWRILCMPLNKPGYHFALMLGTALLFVWSAWVAALAADDTGIIAQSVEYFPDQVGNEWHYRGQITEGPLQTVEHKFFSNVSSVTGTRTFKGVTVTVYHDTNPGNHGPSDSFYRRDTVGIVYYGSEPGTPFEKQLTPYQIVRFPMKIASSFTQFN